LTIGGLALRDAPDYGARRQLFIVRAFTDGRQRAILTSEHWAWVGVAMSRKYCVFVSCVSSEFEKLRDRLSNTLENADVEVITQEKLRRDHGTPILLDILHKEVKRSNIVLCIQGKRSGECPPEQAARKYTGILPSSMTEASFTQWEQFFAMHYQKTFHIFRASEPFKAARPDGKDIPGLQQQFLEIIDSTGAYRGKDFETEGDVLAEVLRLDLRRSPPLWAALLSFVSFFIVFSLVTFLTLNASTVDSLYSDMFSSDTFFRPSIEPSLSYFIAGYGGHTLLIARPSSKEEDAEIDLTIPRSLRPVGCPEDSAKAVPGEPGDCLFTWLDKPRDPAHPEPPPFWLMNTGPSDVEAHVSAILKRKGDRKGDPAGPWSVRFRAIADGGPCVIGSRSEDCFAENLQRKDQDNFSRELYYGHADLKSKYQSASESFNRAAFLAIFGFSLLISWMEREVIRLDLAFGKVWQLVDVLRGRHINSTAASRI